MPPPDRPVRLRIFEETYEAVRSGLLTETPTAPAPRQPAGRHHWRTDPEETRVARHGDDDGDGLANQADPDWRGGLPTVPAPVTPLGPDDPEDPVYSRTGDHEPPRWPEPPQEQLHELRAAAADVDPDWLARAAQPIDPDDVPDTGVALGGFS